MSPDGGSFSHYKLFRVAFGGVVPIISHLRKNLWNDRGIKTMTSFPGVDFSADSSVVISTPWLLYMTSPGSV